MFFFFIDIVRKIVQLKDEVSILWSVDHMNIKIIKIELDRYNTIIKENTQI